MSEEHDDDSYAQLEAKDELSLDPIPDMPAGKLTVRIGEDNAGPPAVTQVEGLLHGPFGLYADPEGSNPTSEWVVSLLATGEKIVTHEMLAPFGMIRQQARRFAAWLSVLDWTTDGDGKYSSETSALASELIHAYKLRDWIRVKKAVENLDGKRKTEYNTPVKVTPDVPHKPQTENTMSEVNGTSATATPTKRGRRKRDPNSKAAIARPGVSMKPVCNFVDAEVKKLEQEFGEKAPLIFATGVYVLTQLPIEQQAEAFKQAKIKNVENIRKERSAQGETVSSAS